MIVKSCTEDKMVLKRHLWPVPLLFLAWCVCIFTLETVWDIPDTIAYGSGGLGFLCFLITPFIVHLLRIDIVLDRKSNLLRWEGRTPNGPDTVSFPLTDIENVLIEEFESRRNGTVYRVAVQKKDGTIFPLSKSYSNGKAHHERLRNSIERFLHNIQGA